MALYRRNFFSYKPQCIVLDIDETLVHSSQDYNKLNEITQLLNKTQNEQLQSRLYILPMKDAGVPYSIWGLTRPYLTDFIDYCFARFDKVCVWSAGTADYVHKVVETIFPAHQQPDIILCRGECHYATDNTLFKPLAKLVDKIEGLELYNTFIVDDRLTTFLRNPANGILIPEYAPTNPLQSDDSRLIELMEWFSLDEVRSIPDVRLLEKTTIFS